MTASAADTATREQSTAARANKQSSTRAAGGHLSFRPDIEGLRALGVTLVVAFHAAVPHLAGGFVGVDVFFVISGFLITGLLLSEGERCGHISLQDFYARRLRRIVPSACLVLLATSLLMTLTFDPLRQYRSVLDLAAALLYVSNWRFVIQKNDYLAVSNDHSPVLHYWSLSVEEQFYLVWPLLIVFCVYTAQRLGWKVTRLAPVVLGAVTAVSLYFSFHLTTTNPNLAYLATHTRAWQFGVGGLLAAFLFRSPQWLGLPSARRLRWFLGWAGLSAVAVSAWTYTNSTTYPGTAALLPTFGSLAIIFAGSRSRDVADGAEDRDGGTPPSCRWNPAMFTVSRLFGWRPLRWVGRMSYAWYLWHWPLIVVAQAQWPDMGVAWRSLVMLFALLLGWLTNRLVERPLINGALFKRSRVASVMAAVVATILCGGTLVVVGESTHAGLTTASTSVPSSQFATVFGRETRRAGSVTPTPFQAASDLPAHSECLLVKTSVEPPTCTFGRPDGVPVVLFGDSHANQWQSPLTTIANHRGWRLHVITHGACPIAIQPLQPNASLTRDCARWRSQQIERIKALRPAVIVLGSLNRYAHSLASERGAWQSLIQELRPSGARIVYVYDTPWPGRDVPACISGHLEKWSACELRLRAPGAAFVTIEHKVLSDLKGVTTVDMTDYLCQGDICPAVRNGVLLYRDDSHISDLAARLLTSPFQQTLKRSGVLTSAARSQS